MQVQLSNSAILARMLSCNTRSWVHHPGIQDWSDPITLPQSNVAMGNLPEMEVWMGKLSYCCLPHVWMANKGYAPQVTPSSAHDCSESHQWYTQSQLLASKNLMAPAPGITWSLLDEVDGDGSQLEDANAQVWHVSNVGATQLCPGSLYSYQKLHMCT